MTGPAAAVPDISVLIVSYNTAHLLDEMFATLRAASTGIAVQPIVIDNASRDDSLAVLRERFADVEVIANPVNVGFGRANNLALARATGRYVLLLNTDAFMAPDALAKTLAYMEEHPDCGVLGVRAIGIDGALQASCRYFPTPLNIFLAQTGLGPLLPRVRMIDDLSWDHASVRDCDWVVGCFYLVRREVIDAVGLFDPRYFLYCEEVDHCKRVKKAGWRVTYFADTHVVHIGGESARSDGQVTAHGRQLPEPQIESMLLFFRKHHGRLGLASHLVLSALSLSINAVKSALRPRPGRLADAWQVTRSMYSLALRTRGGRLPTR